MIGLPGAAEVLVPLVAVARVSGGRLGGQVAHVRRDQWRLRQAHRNRDAEVARLKVFDDHGAAAGGHGEFAAQRVVEVGDHGCRVAAVDPHRVATGVGLQHAAAVEGAAVEHEFVGRVAAEQGVDAGIFADHIGVAACAAAEDVVADVAEAAGPTVQGVVTRSAQQGVVASAAIELIVAGVAFEVVGSALAVHGVGAGAAVEAVALVGAVESFGAVATEQELASITVACEKAADANLGRRRTPEISEQIVSTVGAGDRRICDVLGIAIHHPRCHHGTVVEVVLRVGLVARVTPGLGHGLVGLPTGIGAAPRGAERRLDRRFVASHGLERHGRQGDEAQQRGEVVARRGGQSNAAQLDLGFANK